MRAHTPGRGWKEKSLFGVLLLVLLWSLLLFFSEGRELQSAISAIRAQTWGILAACFLAWQALRACKWQYFLRCLHIAVPFKDSMCIYFSGYALALTPGRMGELLQAFLLEKGFGVALSKGAPIILAGRITGFLGVLSVCFAAIVSVPGMTGIHCIAAGPSLLAVVAIMIAIFRCKTIGKYMAGGIAKLPLQRYAYRRAYRAYLSLHSLLSLPKFMVAFLISVGYWMMECVIFFTIVRSLSVPADVSTAFLVLSAASIGGALSMMPGSIGALEGSAIGLLMYFCGADYTLACAATALHRFFSTWLPFVMGGVFLRWCLRRYRCGEKLDCM